MTQSFAGQSALVCGGAGGLGGATARRMVELGMKVVVFEPDAAGADAYADELGAGAVAVAGDHNDDETVLRAIAKAKQIGEFRLAVNAAGTAINSPPTADASGNPHDMAVFREMMELHLFGPFNLSRLCAAAFASNEPDGDGARGLIVNTASTAAYDGQARQAAYSAAKSGIVGLTIAMARDLAAIGVRANAIAPGPILTPRLASAPDHIKAALTANVAFPKRFGHAEEYANLVEAMLRTPFLNGQTIRLDGALSTPLTTFA
ncbi:SDR family NAD(P)-dependent oxidoreductase [Novosphingobium sp. MW5]|nr:SDR family NAD(P)-dependent oxidoreductase [Novosphingobium sp. MW5]